MPGTADSKGKGKDFSSRRGVLNFKAGETTKQIVVQVNPDTDVEGDEDLTVELFKAKGAEITDSTATGTITNDDTASTTP